MTGFGMITSALDNGIKRYFAIHRKAKKESLAAVGLQLLNNIVNGSPKEQTVPPKRTGHLRASGSVFVGGELIGDTRSEPTSTPGTPNTTHSDSANTVTVGFDTPYAARMHEDDWTPGAVSMQSGDVGNKFIEKHLSADKEELMALFAKKQKEAAG